MKAVRGFFLAIMVASLVGCASTQKTTSVEDEPVPVQTEADEEHVQEQEQKPQVVAGMANPFKERSSLSAACKLAGFNMYAPEKVEPSYSAKKYRVIENDLIEIIYTSSAKKDAEMRVRKAVGNLDISGDYNRYAVTKNVNAAGIQLVLRGEEDSYKVASWVSGDYSFAITATQGLAENAVLALVQNIQ